MTTPSPRVKGTKFSSKLAFLEKEHGGEAVTAVLEALSPDDQITIRRVLDLGWYPAALYDSLLQAIVATVGGGEETILERMGEYAAEHQAQGAYQVYFRSGDPLRVLTNMVPMHSMLNDPGEMEVTRSGEHEISVIVRQPPSTRVNCRVANAFYRRAVELTGARSVETREVQCSAADDPCCRFEIRWQV